ncbi:signal peptidase I [Patescibacteria group bacterium]|nr:signal peptidase I [Patescibacteria group bacterium]MBU4000334.1 signal peptidase I [Patescibacteria group bacterium]
MISGLVVVSLLAFAIFLSSDKKFFSPETERGIVKDLGCVSSTEERIVRGNSLTGLIESSETVKIFFGYYDCNEIKKEDIIVYFYAGNEEPLIKIVKGMPEDKFAFQKTEAGWRILINGEAVKNSKGESYSLSEKGSKMLSLYERDYKGIIPANAYLILGNLASGSLDSTHFGLIGKQDILGKAELIKNGG